MDDNTDSDQPVIVKIKLGTIDRKDIPGIDSIIEHIKSSKDEIATQRKPLATSKDRVDRKKSAIFPLKIAIQVANRC